MEVTSQAGQFSNHRVHQTIGHQTPDFPTSPHRSFRTSVLSRHPNGHPTSRFGHPTPLHQASVHPASVTKHSGYPASVHRSPKPHHPIPLFSFQLFPVHFGIYSIGLMIISMFSSSSQNFTKPFSPKTSAIGQDNRLF